MRLAFIAMSLVVLGSACSSAEPEPVAEDAVDVEARLKARQMKTVDWREVRINRAIEETCTWYDIPHAFDRIVDEVLPEEERLVNLYLEDVSAWEALEKAAWCLNMRTYVKDGTVRFTFRDEVLRDLEGR